MGGANLETLAWLVVVLVLRSWVLLLVLGAVWLLVLLASWWRRRAAGRAGV